MIMMSSVTYSSVKYVESQNISHSSHHTCQKWNNENLFFSLVWFVFRVGDPLSGRNNKTKNQASNPSSTNKQNKLTTKQTTSSYNTYINKRVSLLKKSGIYFQSWRRRGACVVSSCAKYCYEYVESFRSQNKNHHGFHFHRVRTTSFLTFLG